MKKLFFLLALCLGSLATWAQTFSAVAPTGQTLYYNITDDWPRKEVEVACPASGWSMSGATKPTGDLTIPSSVTYQGGTYSVTGIGDNAFSGCEGLTSVTIPLSVTVIKMDAFSNCSALTNIIIPHSVTDIRERAFSGCSSLTHIIIPSSVTTISALAFENIPSVYYRGAATGSPWGASQVITTAHTEGVLTYESPYKIMVIGCSPSATNATIPNSVFCIENEAFKNCSTLTSVTIPNSVTIIGDHAFSGCSALTSITIPNSVTTVEDYAFSGCSALTAITIPNSVITVGDYAFSGCTGLKMVSIGESVTRIGENSFEGCINVDTMYYNAINLGSTQSWQDPSRGFCPMQLDTLVIGNKVRTIPEEVFRQQSNLTSVIIPNSVKIIENCAFDYCGNLSNVTFGDSVTIIERWAFEGCGFTSLILPNLLQSIEGYVFNGCGNLRSVTFGDSLKSIGSCAFRCYNLDTLTIPSSVTTIGGDAFSGVKTVIYCGSAEGSPWGALHAGCFYTEGDFVFADESKTTLIDYIGAGGRVTIPSSVVTIGDNAFQDCSTLNSISIPNSVTTIGVNAFSGVKAVAYCGTAEGSPWGALRAGCFCVDGDFVFTDNTKTTLIGYMGAGGRVSIPNSVTIIEDRTFSECTSLTSITIPNSVTTVGEHAFSGCSSLKMVSIGELVTQIGNFSFEGCTHVDTMYYNAKNLENTNDWFIPDHGFRPMELDTLVIGSKVQSLPNNVFYEQNNLTGVTLPNSVTIIGDNAFSYCSSLSHVFFGDSLTSIGMNSFYSCNITNITFPNLLTNISSGAFMSCGNLDTVTIPSSVTTIGGNAFSGVNTVFYCGTATGAPWGALRAGCFHVDGDFVFADNTKTTLVGYIGAGGSVIIPNTVTTIADRAFLGCSTVTSLTVPNSVTTIGDNAFSGMNTVRYCGNAEGRPWGAQRVFGACQDSLYFQDCDMTIVSGFVEGLASANIPDGVTAIASNAFLNCTTLTSVTIPSSLTTIENHAFEGCTNVTTLFYNAKTLATNDIWHNALESNNSYGFRPMPLRTLTVGDSVQTLPQGVFYGQSGLTSLSIPPSMTTIETSAFSGCINVTTLYYNAKNLTTNNNWGNYDISAYGFRQMPLQTLVIGDNVRTLPNYVFYKQTHLSDITLPDSLSSIGDQAFSYCTNLTSITLPESLSTIGDRAFFQCTNLTSITLPESLSTIGNQAFLNCTTLTSLTIPPSVTTIGTSAFSYCIGLTDISLPESMTTISNGIFSYCTALANITLPNSVTTIEEDAFRNCTALDDIILPNTVTSIGKTAFMNCSALTHISIPASVTTLEDNAFEGCGSLTSIAIPTSVTTIGSYAFQNCTALTTLTIPTSVTTIKTGAFKNCTGLASVVIGKSVSTINNSAFEGCTSLKTVYNLSSLTFIMDNTTYGHVAKYALRVLSKGNGFSDHGTGSNTLHQINNNIYTVVDEETDVRTNIPRSTIPANFIYYVGITATNASGWRANEIVLSDDTSRFHSPVHFTASSSSYSRSFTNGNRSTLYLPFSAPIPDGFEVYAFSGYDPTSYTLNFAPVSDNIQAYTPYLVGYDLSKAEHTTCTISATDVLFPQSVSYNYHPASSNDMTFQGTTARTCMNSTNYYGYKNGFFVQSAGGTAENAHAHVNPFRAYFSFSGSPAQMPPVTLGVGFDSSPLGIIDPLPSTPHNTSIRYSNDVFDLMGRRVRSNATSLDGLPSGIYIWHGKKLLHYNN